MRSTPKSLNIFCLRDWASNPNELQEIDKKCRHEGPHQQQVGAKLSSHSNGWSGKPIAMQIKVCNDVQRLKQQVSAVDNHTDHSTNFAWILYAEIHECLQCKQVRIVWPHWGPSCRGCPGQHPRGTGDVTDHSLSKSDLDHLLLAVQLLSGQPGQENETENERVW